MSQYQIAVVVGSIRADSLNRKLALALAHLAPPEFTFEHVRIDTLPLYNQDLDGKQPAEVQTFKGRIAAAQVLLFATPEYNRSMPGVLKNAIDVGTRPSGSNSFAGKPAAVIGASPGARGTALAQQHLRNVLAGIDVLAMPQPEVTVQFEEGLINAEGDIGNERTQKFLQRFVDAYSTWLIKTLAV